MKYFYAKLSVIGVVLLMLLASCGQEVSVPGAIADGAGLPAAPEAYYYEAGAQNELIADVTLMPEGVFDFPSLHIQSELCPFDIERELWHDGYLTIEGTTEHFLLTDTPVRLRGRGNSTWIRGPEKRPLRIRFAEAQYFLDSPYPARDWILLANHFDMSLLRNYAAFYLASMLEGMDWTPFTRIVHLYVNGEYRGVYQLTDERDVGVGRADLTFDPDPTLSEYFFELDGHMVGWLADGNVENVDFFVAHDRAYDIRFPSRSDRGGHLEYLKDYVIRVGEAAMTHSYSEISALVDIDSLVDFYIVQELFKNIDVGNFSVFMQIRGQGENRRLYFGPVWDFDRSAGNTLYWTEYANLFAVIYNEWFNGFFSAPEIYERRLSRWNELIVGPIPQLLDRLVHLQEHYSDALLRNFVPHYNLFEGEPEWFDMIPEATREIKSHSGQLEYLIEWLSSRANWLDDYFNRRIE